MPRKIAILTLIAVLTFITVIKLAAFNPFQEKMEIAFVSTLSNLDESKLQAGQNSVDAINLYFNSINNAGGIDGKQLVLSVHDDQGKPEVALQVAEKIVRSKAIAVIGHRTSGLTLAASKAYEEYGMPVISPENTADELTKFKWFFRTTFSNRVQSVLMANYANKVLKYSKATVVRGDDVYGANLGGQVSSKFKELGGEIINEWVVGKDFAKDTTRIIDSLKASFKDASPKDASPKDVPPKDVSPKDVSPKDVSTQNASLGEASIKDVQDQGILLVAMSYDRAVEFIRQLKLANLNIPILGGNTLSDLAIAQNFKDTPEAKKDQDFFTKDVLAFTPIIFDMLEDSGQKFKAEFERTYKRDLNWQGIAASDATVGVVEALKGIAFSGKNISEIRSLVIDGLRKFNTPATAFNGAGRSIYFDANGDSVTPAYVSLFDRQQLVSAFSQLDLVKDPTLVNDLEEKVKSGEILQISDRYLQKVNIVYVGMDLNHIDNIDESKSSYFADFYLWFRYQNPLPVEEIEFTNDVGDLQDKPSLNKPIDQGIENKVNYKVYRVQSEFAENFDFHRYPFDEQTLKIKFRHSNFTRNQLIYVVDLVGMKGAKSYKIVEKAKRTGVFDSVSSWIFKRIEFFQNTDIQNSTFGHRYLIDADSDIRYSQFNLSVKVRRDARSFTVKNLLPLLFFIIIAYLLMFLPIESISIEAVSGLLLAVVFYHLNLTDKLPKTVGYTVLLDYAFYVVYFLLGLQLLIIVLGNNEKIKSYNIHGSQLIKWGRIAFPTIITLSAVAIFSTTF